MCTLMCNECVNLGLGGKKGEKTLKVGFRLGEYCLVFVLVSVLFDFKHKVF